MSWFSRLLGDLGLRSTQVRHPSAIAAAILQVVHHPARRDRMRKKLESVATVDEETLTWEWIILRFFWCRAAVMLDIPDYRPIVDELHRMFLLAIQRTNRLDNAQMAEWERLLHERVTAYQQAFNAHSDDEQKLTAVDKEFCRRIGFDSYGAALEPSSEIMRLWLLRQGVAQICEVARTAPNADAIMDWVDQNESVFH